MKKQKLKLAQLQVKSFTTIIKKENSQTVKGGEFTYEYPGFCFKDYTIADPFCQTFGCEPA